MRRKIPRWLNFILLFFLLLALFLLASHLVLNSTRVQQWALQWINHEFHIVVEWEKLRFNGATGRFSGEELRVSIPKSNLNAKLKKFKLFISPGQILFKQIQILHLEAHDVEFRLDQPKPFDAFAKAIEISGSLKLAKKNGKFSPDMDGSLRLYGLLLGFSKKPTPWNPAPAWDERLTPILLQYYPHPIPDNKSFAYLERLVLPVSASFDKIAIKNAMLHAFNGQISFAGSWQQKKGDTNLELKTLKPIQIALLPLGKALIRKSFEQGEIDLVGKGKITSLEMGNFKGQLKAKFFGNLNVQADRELLLETPFDFQDGILQFKKLTLKSPEGALVAKGSLDLSKKSLQTHVSGSHLNTQTILRFFTSLDFPGHASVKGKIEGALHNPTFSLQFISDDASFEAIKLGQYRGDLNIKDQNFSLLGTTLDAEGTTGNMRLDISPVFKTSEQKTRLKIDIQRGEIVDLFQTQKSKGTLSGTFEMTKFQAQTLGSGRAKVSNLSLYQIPFSLIEAGLTLEQKRLTLTPLKILDGSQKMISNITPPFVFDFTPMGLAFEGKVHPSLFAKGSYATSDPDHIVISLHCEKTPLEFLQPLIPLKIDQLAVSGKTELSYLIQSPIDSKIEAFVTNFSFLGEEKNLRLASPTLINYANRQIDFHQSNFVMGQNRLLLHGPIGFEGDSNLQMKGSLDLSHLAGLQPWLVEGGGSVDLNLLWRGSVTKPNFKGSLAFKNNFLSFWAYGNELSDTKGTLEVDGNRFSTSGLHFRDGDAPVHIAGWVEYEPPTLIRAADLSLVADELSLSEAKTWHLITNANLKMKGNQPNLKLSGSVNIITGLYYKDYSLSQFVLKPIGVYEEEKPSPWPEEIQSIQLDLDIKSPGDFEIKNNLADLILRADVKMKGNIKEPWLTGNIDVLEGQIHAFGIDFESAQGFATFSAEKKLSPFIEFGASQLIQDYEIRAKVRGYADNLNLNLESVPALTQNEIVSLIAYGRTPEQLTENRRNLFSRAALTSQVVSLLQRPFSKATHLDIVKVEADYSEANPVPSRLSVGKKLSDRFSLSFTTDLSLDEAYKGLVAEYLLLDNLLLKGTKDTGSRYRFDLTWRLQMD